MAGLVSYTDYCRIQIWVRGWISFLILFFINRIQIYLGKDLYKILHIVSTYFEYILEKNRKQKKTMHCQRIDRGAPMRLNIFLRIFKNEDFGFCNFWKMSNFDDFFSLAQRCTVHKDRNQIINLWFLFDFLSNGVFVLAILGKMKIYNYVLKVCLIRRAVFRSIMHFINS